MDSIIFLFSLFFALELFESNWQKSDTLYGLLDNNYQVYKKNIFLYFIMNPTFLFSLYLAITLNNFGFWMISIIVLKFLDISMRLNVMQKIDKDEEITTLVPFDINMNIYLRYMNILIYIPALTFALFL
ncbi:MAG TPA: hypothetical protein EYG97_00090 [Arcobacter sp.]|nr:hypothetical protein [Arcobacter sp.]HIP55407.1 hypothetical protein [Arcobacter sp.]